MNREIQARVVERAWEHFDLPAPVPSLGPTWLSRRAWHFALAAIDAPVGECARCLVGVTVCVLLARWIEGGGEALQRLGSLDSLDVEQPGARVAWAVEDLLGLLYAAEAGEFGNGGE